MSSIFRPDITRGLGDHLSAIVKDPRYGFREVPSDNGNVSLSYRAQLGDATITVDIFRRQFWEEPWAHVEITFGEVRKVGSCPMADGGIVSASSEYRAPGTTPVGGSALPGFDLVGLKWRVMGVAPRSRTSVLGDGYIRTENIVEHLLSLREKVAVTAPSPGDPIAAEWDGEDEDDEDAMDEAIERRAADEALSPDAERCPKCRSRLHYAPPTMSEDGGMGMPTGGGTYCPKAGCDYTEES